MTWLKQHWRGASRVFPLLFFCVAAFFGYWWLYKFAPARRILHPGWYESHSRQEYWCEVQKGIHRGTWFHDEGFTVGEYGGKPWAAWIMAHVESGADMSCMGKLSHSAMSMRYITNHDLGYEAGAWLEWWEENKAKSQLEWIEEGFLHHGYEIAVPPQSQQIPTLLMILGDPERAETGAFPDEMKYNAFRCLRDSGFEPVAFAISNRELSPEVENGLTNYAEMERRWPPANGLGILPFEQHVEVETSYHLPILLMPGFQIMAYAVVFGPLLLGVVVLIHSIRSNSPPNTAYVLFVLFAVGSVTLLAGAALARLF